ncbi:hypothetical protein Pogu_0404 [Pyrobaculum oguniense TE7]|uniref:Uncharacterized protein n=1 Tax=Pyrobaculum oguniense (strain DSM 13380 / JCM 10595 / TE7) TaxID=698757 RepID=H6Q733_PYROT|nr:hypothetical protein Pogu_0404 [Pyrobaculum oguniense TE7]
MEALQKQLERIIEINRRILVNLEEVNQLLTQKISKRREKDSLAF